MFGNDRAQGQPRLGKGSGLAADRTRTMAANLGSEGRAPVSRCTLFADARGGGWFCDLDIIETPEAGAGVVFRRRRRELGDADGLSHSRPGWSLGAIEAVRAG